MNKLIFFLLWLVVFCSPSCKTNNKIEIQVKSDLVGMLHGKVQIEQILIHGVTKNSDGNQQVNFDCQLYFTDDLYKDNGELAFKKGLRVHEKGNIFIYSDNEANIKLIGFEFGESRVLD